MDSHFQNISILICMKSLSRSKFSFVMELLPLLLVSGWNGNGNNISQKVLLFS